MPKISIIVAMADDLAIGKDNGLLCHIPGDLKRFKELTNGHTIIMGRKTLESLPNGPLPNRRNIVITHHPETLPDGCVSAVSLDDATSKCVEDDEVFIIGGGQIYSQAITKADMIYLTRIHSTFPDADTFFPEYNASDYDEVFYERHEPSEKCKYAFSFVNWKKKNKKIEINELQICDIVTFIESLEDGCITPVKIEALGYQGDWDAEENNALVKIGDSVDCDVIVIDESIVGIPLTTEILKMNGWIYNDKEAKYAPETWVGNNLMLHEDNGRYRVVVVSGYDDEDTNNAPFVIQYVHELQHALRLCGRKDVANKLKIHNNYEN